MVKQQLIFFIFTFYNQYLTFSILMMYIYFTVYYIYIYFKLFIWNIIINFDQFLIFNHRYYLNLDSNLDSVLIYTYI